MNSIFKGYKKCLKSWQKIIKIKNKWTLKYEFYNDKTKFSWY